MCNESDAYEDGEKDVLEGAGSRRGLSANVDALNGQYHRICVRAGDSQQEPQPKAPEEATTVCTNLNFDIRTLTHRNERIITDQSSDDLTI